VIQYNIANYLIIENIMSSCKSHQHCIDQALKTAEAICQKNGQQLTDIRRKVLSIIWQSHQPAKAYDILEKLADAGYSGKPPTVYRALDFLIANRLIHKINRINAFVGCSHAEREHGCYLFFCQQCKQVTECCNFDFANALDRLANEFSFQLSASDIELEGTCGRCK
jgi:Fe2+/Zn2+ uptake regulation proteins